MVNVEDINKLYSFFQSKKTYDVAFRIEQLERLEKAINEYEEEILQALKSDLNKSSYEAFFTEILTVIMDIKFIKKRLRSWVKPKMVRTPITHFPGKSYLIPEPYGVVLIISPWNYPFQLAMMPLIGAIAGGNCALIKPSEQSPHTARIIEKIIAKTFPSDYVKVVLGGREENQNLLKQKFDLIFFTGSVNVGKIVMEAASKNLTPVILELGGKSPCIVDETADLQLAAKRIVWGKMINLGQTCVAPDYLLVHRSVKNLLYEEIIKVINEYYHDYHHLPKIISKRHFDRLRNLIVPDDIIIGGNINEKTEQIDFTLINATWESEIMQEEIFGPILPIITYNYLDEVIIKINDRPKPLALYLFTNNKDNEKLLIKQISFGGGCINDTIMHIATPYLPFGGVGNSGMGSYHGKQSFDAFSHYKSILKKFKYLDFSLRYPPYDKDYKKIKRFIK